MIYKSDKVIGKENILVKNQYYRKKYGPCRKFKCQNSLAAITFDIQT